MEAVAATASIAAILSLVGKTIVGIEQLSIFCSDISSASSVTDKFLRDVNGLLKTLYNIRMLVEKVPTIADTYHVASLQIQLEDCAKDVPGWLAAVIKDPLPSSSNGTKGYVQKVKIAMNRKKTEKIRIEMNRSRAALNTSLAVLGRWLDIHIHHQVQEVKGQVEKFSQGVLDKCEAQEATLDRIEHHTKSNMSSSASSNFTLDSINSSLSELKSDFESFTTSWKPSVARRELLDDSAHKPWDSVVAPSESHGESEDEHPLYTTPAAIPGHGFRPRQNLELHVQRAHCNGRPSSETQDSRITDVEAPMRRESQEELLQLHDCLTRMYPAFPRTEFELPSPRHGAVQDPQALTGLCSPLLLQYISLVQRLQSYESSLRILNLLCHRRAIANTDCESDEALAGYDSAMNLRLKLMESFKVLRDEKQKVRKACIIAGHSVHEIDTLMANPSLEQPHQEQATHLPSTINHQGMLSIRKHTQDSRLLHEWCTTRDRINSWLLTTLRSDEQQAQLHRSMLAEPIIDDEVWARTVLRHWNLDEAATGANLDTSHSVGAENSRDQSQSGGEDAHDLAGTTMQRSREITLRAGSEEGSSIITVVNPQDCNPNVLRMIIHLPGDRIAQRVSYLETGADMDLISRRVFLSLGLQKDKSERAPTIDELIKILHELQIILCELKTILREPEWEVSFKWHIDKFDKSYTATFVVTDDRDRIDLDVRLGRRTIASIEYYTLRQFGYLAIRRMSWSDEMAFFLWGLFAWLGRNVQEHKDASRMRESSCVAGKMWVLHSYDGKDIPATESERSCLSFPSWVKKWI